MVDRMHAERGDPTMPYQVAGGSQFTRNKQGKLIGRIDIVLKDSGLHVPVTVVAGSERAAFAQIYGIAKQFEGLSKSQAEAKFKALRGNWTHFAPLRVEGSDFTLKWPVYDENGDIQGYQEHPIKGAHMEQIKLFARLFSSSVPAEPTPAPGMPMAALRNHLAGSPIRQLLDGELLKPEGERSAEIVARGMEELETIYPGISEKSSPGEIYDFIAEAIAKLTEKQQKNLQVQQLIGHLDMPPYELYIYRDLTPEQFAERFPQALEDVTAELDPGGGVSDAWLSHYEKFLPKLKQRVQHCGDDRDRVRAEAKMHYFDGLEPGEQDVMRQIAMHLTGCREGRAKEALQENIQVLALAYTFRGEDFSNNPIKTIYPAE